MEQLSGLIAERTDHALELAIFGSADPYAIGDAIRELVEPTLGLPRRVLFYRPGVGLVVGLNCETAGNVVVKIHRRDAASAVFATHQIQARLFDAGFPAPRPLLSPTPVGSGLATVDELITSDRVDGRSPSIRRMLAGGLHDFIEAAQEINFAAGSFGGLRAPLHRIRLWGAPHDTRFDFDKTSSGAEWIDRAASKAQHTLTDSTLPDVVAHLDWRVQNVAFQSGYLCGVFDWDSVGLAPEAVAVGQASAQFSTDWTVGHTTLPTIPEMSAFVEAFESARGAPFSVPERVVLDAANLLVVAYAARCEHSDRVLCPELAPSNPPDWVSLLKARRNESL